MTDRSTTSSSFVARHFMTGDWVRVTLAGSTIAEVQAEAGPDTFDDMDPWVAPALWDLQTNGRWGVSFADGSLTVEQVARIVQAHNALGVARLCPTLITASREALRHGVRTIAAACDSDPKLDRRILGIHLEGPWISPIDGYRGAHSRAHVRDPDWSEFEELQQAAGSRIVMVTLAPERPGAIEFCRKLTESGVVVAIGHSAADFATIDSACRAGLRISTHLGNGLPAILPRHPNPIWWQSARDDLFASFIADGIHVDPVCLGILLRIKTADRAILVSDASPLADALPGVYGPWEVKDDGTIVVAGTPYLAGSNLDLWRAIPSAMSAAGFSLAEAIHAASAGPARVLNRPQNAIEANEPADVILFRRSPDDAASFFLIASHIGDTWTLPV